MNRLKRALSAVAVSVALGASLVAVPLTMTEAKADVLVLRNSGKSNTGFYAYADNNCKGKKDYVPVEETAKGVGKVGSIMIPANTKGYVTPWYKIKARTKQWCWNTPTSLTTTVYLNKMKAGSW